MRSTPEASVTRPRRVGPVVAAVMVAYLLFVGARLAVFAADPSGFVAAGDLVTDVTEAPAGLVVTPGTSGYDGQAYYRLSRAPWTDQVTEHGIAFTRPAYWQSRIGYPAVVWVLSAGGRAALVPTVMLAVNLVAVAAIAALAAVLARDLGRSPWWGGVPALWAGFLVGVGQDLTEPLAGALLLAALLALRRGRPAPATLALVAAGLTRETTLVVAVAVLLAAALTRGGVRRAAGGSGTSTTVSRSVPSRPVASRPVASSSVPPWWVGAVPLAVCAGWRLVVRQRWADVVPEAPGDNVLRLPLEALLGYLGAAAQRPGPEAANLVLLAPALVALVIAGTGVARQDGPLHERLALAGYLALLVCLPVWDRGQAYLRWGCEPLLLGWLLLLGARTAPAAGRLRALGALCGVVWLLTATQSVGYPRADPGGGSGIGAWVGWWTWS
ncbi:hypothetical protein [Nocardioides sambongensis]|uniref:hypothetical protein n=1 Tax=Nocardioides sambongensis TaxID=2589074 RepID=UPI00112627D6|nr:hypothetical protein [Nocardioides sambongensis]